MGKEVEIKNGMIMEQFIGIFPNAINDNLCSEFVNFFNMASEQSLTMSSTMESTLDSNFRKDEVIHIPAGLSNDCFPHNILLPFWEKLSESFNQYRIEYAIDQLM